MNFWFDQPRSLLIYQPPSPLSASQVLQHVEGAKELNGSYLAVPATLRNSQILRWLQYPVQPIITGQTYDFPRNRNLVPHPYESQIITSNFLVLNPRSFVLSDMGVGKTLATLWAADYLMRRQPGARALIVAPLSILERVWASAIFTHLRARTADILHGTAEKRMQILESSKADFLIINFDGVGIGAHTRKKFELDGFSKALAGQSGIRIVIVDEASGYRDATTKRHRIARHVIGRRDYLWLLTGTPTPNAPTDAYGLAKLVNNAQGKSFRDFRQETMYQPFPNSFKWRARQGGYDRARALLQPSIRFDIKDVWDGPEMTVQQRQVELTPEQKRAMKELKDTLVVTLKSGKQVDALNEASLRIKFLQISLGGVYDKDHRSHAIDAKPRIDELKSVIEQAPSKLLIFVPLTNVVNMLYKELSKQWTCEVVNGDVPQSKRSSIFSAFQQEEAPRILIADPGTMAHGLDLWRAQTVVWFGPTEKTELYLQANKRAHRPGQKFPVTVVQVVSNKLEEEIYKRLENNTAMQGALLDLVRRGEI